MSCDHSHILLHCLRNKRKRKIESKKIDKKKRKTEYKSLSVLWYLSKLAYLGSGL